MHPFFIFHVLEILIRDLKAFRSSSYVSLKFLFKIESDFDRLIGSCELKPFDRGSTIKVFLYIVIMLFFVLKQLMWVVV